MKSLEELAQIRDRASREVDLRREKDGSAKIIVGMGTRGIAAGAREVLQAVVGFVSDNAVEDVVVGQDGALELPDKEPVLEILIPGTEKVVYASVTPEMVPRIIQESIVSSRAADSRLSSGSGD